MFINSGDKNTSVVDIINKSKDVSKSTINGKDEYGFSTHNRTESPYVPKQDPRSLNIVDRINKHSAMKANMIDVPSKESVVTSIINDYQSGSFATGGPKGDKGEKGDKGDPFTIAKSFASVEEMNSGYASDGVALGSFVLVDTGNVEDEDNAKLYVKGSAAYVFVTDLSGATGIKGDKGDVGPQGPQGIQGPKGDTGAQGPQGIQGPKGDQGEQGIQGPVGATGPKGDTGETGPQGPKGDTGEQGIQGPKGDPGDKGDPGEPGIPGDKGDPGVRVVSIALTVDTEGKVIGGVAIFSDNTTSEITVTTAE